MHQLFRSVIFLAVTGLSISISQGAIVSWDGEAVGTPKYLNDAVNWAGDILPGPSDIATIANGGVATVDALHSYPTILGGLLVGSAGTSGGAIYQSGGTVSVAPTAGGWGGIGDPGIQDIGNATYGFYQISGGELLLSQVNNAYFDIGYNAPGVLEQTGGTVTVVNGHGGGAYTIIGKNSKGVLDVSGGVYNTVAENPNYWDGMMLGRDGVDASGVLNIRGTGQVNLLSTNPDNLALNAGQLTMGCFDGGSAIVNLGGVGTGGGTLQLANIMTSGSGTKCFNFHGGTLKAYQPQANFWANSPIMRAYVYSEGANLDAGMYDANTAWVMNISQPLEDPTGYGLTDSAISIADGGSGYIGTPIVTITTTGGGVGATANAIVTNGVVTGIAITNPGTGYLPGDTVEISIDGGGYATMATASVSSIEANLLNNDAVPRGEVKKLGEGTTVLSGANTYHGPTTVQQGRLIVTSSGDVSQSSGVTVKDTAVLGGTSYNIPNVVVETGGAIDPGDAAGAAGTISLGSLKLQDGSKLHFDLLDTGTNNDTISVIGNVEEYAAGSSATVTVDYSAPTGFTSNLILMSAAALDPNDKITFTLPGDKPVLDSFDGKNTTQVELHEYATTLELTAPGPISDPSWNNPAGGSYQDVNHWGDSPYGPVPLNGSQRAMFTRSLSPVYPNSDIPITLDADPELSSIVFDNYYGEYRITPSGDHAITLNSTIAENWNITVLSGVHTIEADIRMAAGTDESIVRLNSGTQLILGGTLSDLNPEAPARLAVNGDFNGYGTPATVVLGGANTYTGPTIVANAVLEIPSVDVVANPNPLGQSGVEPGNFVLDVGTLHVGPAGGTTDRGITLQGSTTLQIDGNTDFSGQVVSSTSSRLDKTGLGTLTLSNTGASTTNIGGIGVHEGVLAIAGGAETVYNTGNSNSSGGIVVGWTGSAAVRQSGGTITSNTNQIVGFDAYGCYQLSGGTFQWSPDGTDLHIGYGAQGIFEQTGGTAEGMAPENVEVGGDRAYSGATGVLNVFGGTFAVNVSQVVNGVVIGWGGTGILNLGGTEATAQIDLLGLGEIAMGVGDFGSTPGTAIVNLGQNSTVNPGWIKPYGTPASSTFNFHGGTLIATASSIAESTDPNILNPESFMDSIDHAYIYPEGAMIRVEEGDSSLIYQVFEDPTGKGLADTAITVTDGGSDYIGPPVVTIDTLSGAGTGATAVAIMDGSGHVIGIRVTNPGTGYSDSDSLSITFSGGGASSEAAAVISTAALVQNAGGDLQKSGPGELVLAAASTYTGATKVMEGTLSIATIADGGTASPIGASSNVPENLVLDGGVLHYTGAEAAITDRGFTVGPNDGTVLTDNHLTFSGDVVGDSTGGLVKDGVGVLTLSGNLTYTGPTDIRDGLLEIAHTTSTVTLAGGVTSSTQTGDLAVLDGVDLTTPSIAVRALTIGGSGVAPAPAPVPEPSTWLLLTLAGLGSLVAARRRT